MMKTKMLMLIGLLALLFAPVMAQDIPPPTDIVGVLMGLQIFLGSLPGAVALLFFLVPFVLGGLNISGKFLKYVMTTVVVAVVCVVAYFVDFGFLHGSEWWTIPFNIALIMLVQVGFFAIDFIKNIQDKVYDKFNPWKPPTG